MDPFPDVVRIETSGVCNSCIYCPRHFQGNHGKLMSSKQLENIVTQFRKYNFIPRVIVLYHGGEPLLDRDIESKIIYFKELGVKKVSITTNGSLLTKNRAKSLLHPGIDEIQISFDDNSPEENNKQRIGGDFFRDAKKIKYFLDLKRLWGKKVDVFISNVRLLDYENFLAEKLNQIILMQQFPTQNI